MSKPFVSMYCQGERCFCGAPAEHKVEETIFDDDPHPNRHELTRYICHEHFRQIMGPAADRDPPLTAAQAAHDAAYKARQP